MFYWKKKEARLKENILIEQEKKIKKLEEEKLNGVLQGEVYKEKKNVQSVNCTNF